jgi:hypothetical protein
MRLGAALALCTCGLAIGACATTTAPPDRPAIAPMPPFATLDGDPPVVPYKEEIATDYGVLEAWCLAAIGKMPGHLDWVWGDKLLTRSQSYGFIWRADYTTARDPDPTHINRLVCSLLPSGSLDVQIALDQPVDRLSVEAKRLAEETL